MLARLGLAWLRYHPYLTSDPHDGSDVPDHRSRPNAIFDRPGNDIEDSTALERSLCPAGDTVFWFSEATVGRCVRGATYAAERWEIWTARTAATVQT